jgi:AcrR family transcriptional regulator
MAAPRTASAPRAGGSARPDADAAIRVARRRFFAGQRIDVGAIAQELGVNRTTIYRWFGGRDELLAGTLDSMTDQTLAWAAREAGGSGRERIFEVLRRFTEAIATHAAYRHFLRNEPEAAARVLFVMEGSLRARMTDRIEQLLRSEPEALTPDVDARTVAFAIVRVGEAFIYGEQLGNADPDVDELLQIIALILRSPVP